MQESIKARISNQMFHSEKITNSVRHFSLLLCPFFLCPLFPFPPFFCGGGGEGGGGATSQLIWGARKFLVKRGVITYYRSDQWNPTSPPSPIKSEQSPKYCKSKFTVFSLLTPGPE